VPGIRVSNPLWPERSARLLGATPTAHWLEDADRGPPILAQPLEVLGGMAQGGDTRGSGFA
jgi:hypothetical protein